MNKAFNQQDISTYFNTSAHHDGCLGIVDVLLSFINCFPGDVHKKQSFQAAE